ncbi:hydroxymethylglutaryl-CoA synthase family protein [Chitinophaga sp. Mgbs1]|uniref:Hydroxymethylglutaryl-CoA synthase family protein n=1 Tax=Chitinophaga solisilvae TaxID=1233460 RepID=A0A433WJI7_9BACT|nr:hydroxymethylglutaryl-CoA synthase family protein [Chitinophaga solisilvae]
MLTAGIEAINVYGGTASLSVDELALHRNLDNARFKSLLMKEKTVALPYEDPVTFAVNAAKPIMDRFSTAEKGRIELLITCTESGIDFGKSISTYVHQYLGLNRNCRLFEIKQACYSGTAGLQMAVNFILSGVSPGAKALVIATDISRFIMIPHDDTTRQETAFAELSNGAGGVAMLIGENPIVFKIDAGANGYYGHEVMDVCRPLSDSEVGDADLSLLSYMECSEQAYKEYEKRVKDADYRESFRYLSFHTPFGGMIKGAHRTIMRKLFKATPIEIEADFENRVYPGLIYCQQAGNMMGGSVFMSLASTIDNGNFNSPGRVGCFSYGSGCCSEFFSGIVSKEGQAFQQSLRIQEQLNRRYKLTFNEYEIVTRNSINPQFGVRDMTPDFQLIPAAWDTMKGASRLYLKEIKNFYRKYAWEV